MSDLRFYSVLRGQSYWDIAEKSVRSLLQHNPEIKYTLILLDCDPGDRLSDLRGKVDILTDSLDRHKYPGDERMGVFWYRYAVAPDMLSEDFICQLDLDMVCMAPLPLGELSPAYVNGVVDPSSSDLLDSLSAHGWWCDPDKRKVYVNAGFLAWSKKAYSRLFSEMSRLMVEDGKQGVLSDSPFDDQAYINAVLNSKLNTSFDVNILHNKWNYGIWEEAHKEKALGLRELKKILLCHVFSYAGDTRNLLIEELYRESMGE